MHTIYEVSPDALDKKVDEQPINKCNQPTNSGVSLVVSVQFGALSINVAQDHYYDIYIRLQGSEEFIY